MNAPPERIETVRLLLRRPVVADAKAKYELSHDPEVVRYMDWGPHANLEGATALIDVASKRWDSGEGYSWTITVPPDDHAIGSLACSVRGHSAEIGYVLARNAWGRGYASEAAKAVLEWATSLADIQRIWSTCDVDNGASARVMEKIGMTREGVLRRYAVRPNLAPGVPRDAFIYSWIRDGRS